jgi:hypothetical protein
MGLIISYAVGYLTGALFILLLYEKFKDKPMETDKSNDDPTVSEKEDKNPIIGFFS